MLIRTLLASALVSLSLVSFAAPVSRFNNLSVSIAPADPATRADRDVAVDVVFTNTGDTPISVVKWFMPDGEPEGDLFLLSRNGEAVPYVGPIIKRAAPTAHDMITLQAGESVTRTAELSGLYDLSQSGVYTIQYGVASAHVFGQPRSSRLGNRVSPDLTTQFDADDSARLTTVFSNEASKFIEGRKDSSSIATILQKTPSALETILTQSISYSGRCSASQQSAIVSAASAAQTMTNGAVTYLSATPKASARFTTWFGTFSTANWNEVKGHYVNIKTELDSKPVVFDCSCKKSYYAYVYPTQPYKIYLCNAFWTAPLTGTDSKGGTIIHESSHFNVNAGTQDYAYGQTAAKSLAISNPSQARFNADSHEYFAENTPALQ